MSARELPPDQAERDRALDIGSSALAIAPAGSGKTSLLVARMLKCLAVSNEPEEVVAITFTRMAAAEIRARLVHALQAAMAEAPAEPHQQQLHALARAALARDQARGWKLLENPNRLRALTIDALNLELAAGLPLLSGLGGPVAIAEDGEALFEEATRLLFADIEDGSLPAEDRAAIERVLRWGDNRIDALLEPLCGMLEKREQWLESVLDQLAGAPGAETEILEAVARARIGTLCALLDSAERDELVAILREGSARAEPLAWAAALERCPDAEPAALEIWRRIAETLLTADGKLRASVDIRNGFVAGQRYKMRMVELLRRLQAHPRADQIARACCDLRDCPDTSYPAPLAAHRAALLRVLHRLCGHLRVVFSRRRQADFTEVGFAALNALSDESGYSEALDKADARIRHLLVDEMQDTSESQVRLLRRLTSGWTPGDGHSLFMVGDPQQSIYAFRKAEVRLFLRLWNDGRLGEVPLQRVKLSTNFRSSAPLIRWFNDSFSGIFPAQEDLYGGAVPFSASTTPHGAATAPEPAVTIVPLDEDAATEAEAVAQRIQALEGESTVAIIARARPHLRQVLAALRRHGIAYACQDIDPLHDIPGVREFVHLARALWHAEDRLAWAVLLRGPLVGLSYADLVALSSGRTRESWPCRLRRAAEAGVSAEGLRRLEHLQQVLARADEDPLLYADLPARAEAVWHALGGPATVSADELRDVRSAMQQLRAAAQDGELESLAGLRRALQKAFAAPAAGRVQVLTAHKAKGLEFDHVLLVGCGRGTRREDQPILHFRRLREGLLLVPKPDRSLAQDDPARRLYRFAHQLQEEALRNERLRVLYVCCTRARRSLSLFVNATAAGDGQPRFAADSFAQLLRPVIDDALWRGALAAQSAARTTPLVLPLMPRLPVDYRFVPDDAAWRPRERRTLRPSEAVLDAQEQREPEGELRARLIGVMFHEAMRRIAAEGLEHWQDAGVSRRLAMAAGFRHLGLPEPEVAGAVDRVLHLLARCLGSERGRWLLRPRAWTQSEYAVAGYREGEWVSAIVDRCFEEDGVVWVVDYKTGRESAAEAAARYGNQVGRYAALIATLRRQPARGALFLAETADWVEVNALEPEPA